MALSNGFHYNNPPPCIGLSGILILGQSIPTVFKLYHNYPNPFNPSTLIKFDIAKASNVRLFVYDILGREVVKLVDENMKAGSYEFTWDAIDFASGSYFYKLETKYFTDIKMMILVK